MSILRLLARKIPKIARSLAVKSPRHHAFSSPSSSFCESAASALRYLSVGSSCIRYHLPVSRCSGGGGDVGDPGITVLHSPCAHKTIRTVRAASVAGSNRVNGKNNNKTTHRDVLYGVQCTRFRPDVGRPRVCRVRNAPERPCFVYLFRCQTPNTPIPN